MQLLRISRDSVSDLADTLRIQTFQEFSLYDPRDGKLRSQLNFRCDVLTVGACAFCPSAGDLTFDDQAGAC